jgi:16S rRNA (guanine527-N7)-methyltransferase
MNYKQFCEFFPLTEDAFQKILAFQDLLLKWNAVHNLIQRKTEDSFFTRHVLDSLELYDFLEAQQTKQILDVGTGAGFPGIILSIAGLSNITLNEINYRKIAFLKEGISTLNLASSIETVPIQNIIKKYDIFISRAFKDIKKTFDHFQPERLVAKYFYLIKGPAHLQELEEANKSYSFNADISKGKYNSYTYIVLLKDITKK